MSWSAGESFRRRAGTPTGRRSRWLVAAVAAVAVALVGVAALRLRADSRSVGAPPPSRPLETAPALAAPPPRTVTVHATPPSARLELDGVPLEGDSVSIEADGPVRSLRVSAPGYLDERRLLDPKTPDPLAIVLTPAPRPHVPAIRKDPMKTRRGSGESVHPNRLGKSRADRRPDEFLDP
jgi:hypothetical protein